MKNIILKIFVAIFFQIFFLRRSKKNFFHQMLQKPQKHEKHDFWDFESFEILDRDFWIFRFAIIFELEKKKQNHTIFLKLFLLIQKLMNFQKSIWFTYDNIFQYIEKSIWNSIILRKSKSEICKILFWNPKMYQSTIFFWKLLIPKTQ